VSCILLLICSREQGSSRPEAAKEGDAVSEAAGEGDASDAHAPGSWVCHVSSSSGDARDARAPKPSGQRVCVMYAPPSLSLDAANAMR